MTQTRQARWVVMRILLPVFALMLPSVQGSALQAQRVLRAIEDLRIDAAKSDLVPIAWMWVSPRGNIVVSQPQDQNFRIFAPTGQPLATFGRKGSGPGEFISTRGSRGGWWCRCSSGARAHRGRSQAHGRGQPRLSGSAR